MVVVGPVVVTISTAGIWVVVGMLVGGGVVDVVVEVVVDVVVLISVVGAGVVVELVVSSNGSGNGGAAMMTGLIIGCPNVATSIGRSMLYSIGSTVHTS